MTTVIENKRQSGIELLRIIAMFFIVLSHVVGSLEKIDNLGFSCYFASTKFENILLIFFNYLGSFGNSIFMVVSCWFLSDSNKSKKSKIIKLILDNFFISVLILTVYLCLDYYITPMNKLEAMFPTYFGSSWYITVYLMIYIIHPYLNTIINGLNKKELRNVCIVLSIVYLVLCNIVTISQYNQLSVFIAYYFVVAFVKKYEDDFINDKEKVMKILVIASLIFVCFLLSINMLGVKIDILEDKVMHFNDIKNPLIFVISFSIFILVKDLKIESKKINYVSSLTTVIYLIHANDIYLSYTQSDLLYSVILGLNNLNIVCVVLLFALFVFLVCLIFSIVYKLTLEKLVKRIVLFLS